MEAPLVIVISSVVIQLLSAIVALRITLSGGRRTAGILMLVLILLMAFRRTVSLFHFLTEGHAKLDLLAEVIALAISVLVLIGMVYISRLIASLRILSGLLPICASCKKVRDDKGYWTQIEAYVSERSAAEFSHGICPECTDVLYKEYCRDTAGKDALPRERREPPAEASPR